MAATKTVSDLAFNPLNKLAWAWRSCRGEDVCPLPNKYFVSSNVSVRIKIDNLPLEVTF